jgi:hypothetical protein
VASKGTGKGSVDCQDALARFAHALDPTAFTKDQLDVAVAQALKEVGKPKRMWDYAVEFQINSLLSGLGTPIANVASVIYKQVTNPLIDAVEALNPKSSKAFRDIVSAIDQARQGFGSDLVYFKSGWTTGYPLDIVTGIRDAARKMGITEKDARKALTNSIIEQRVRIALQRDPSLDEQALTKSFQTNYKPTDAEIEKFLQESYDYVRGTIPGPAGEVIRWPTKLSVAIDEYGKARFRRYKIGMMASQKARADAARGKGDYKTLRDKYTRQSMEHITVDDKGNLTWPELAETVKKNFGRLQEDVNTTFVKTAQFNPYETVKEYALREMFQQKLTGLPKGVADFRNKHPSVSLFIPFLKTPWNITKEGFSYVPVIPQVMKKYMQGNVDDAIPGAYYEISYEEMAARQILGVGAFATVMGLVEEGRITGKPRDAQEAQAWKDAGIPQASVRLGDTWISYDRIEPLATVLGLSSEMARTWDEIGNLPEVDQKWEIWGEEIGKGTMFALKANIMQKSFIEGFNDFVNTAYNNGDVGFATGVTAISRQFTPAFINQAARISDPYERQASSPIEKIMQRIPGLRQQLPPEYGLIGEPRETNKIQALTSFNIQTADQTPLERYIYDLGVTKMREDKSLKGVDLNNEQLAILRKMSSEFITPRLERYVASESFRNLPDARKKIKLEKQIDRLKSAPRQRFYSYLRRTDPVMAKKFRVEVLRKQGRLDKVNAVNQ